MTVAKPARRIGHFHVTIVRDCVNGHPRHRTIACSGRSRTTMSEFEKGPGDQENCDIDAHRARISVGAQIARTSVNTQARRTSVSPCTHEHEREGRAHKRQRTGCAADKRQRLEMRACSAARRSANQGCRLLHNCGRSSRATASGWLSMSAMSKIVCLASMASSRGAAAAAAAIS